METVKNQMANSQSTLRKIIRAGFLPLCFPLVVSSCALGMKDETPDPKIAILEQRVFDLEQEKINTKNELLTEFNELKQSVSTKLDNIRKSQQFFLEELNQMRDDLQLTTDHVEKNTFETRKQRKRLDVLVRRVGDQVIALEELKAFFENEQKMAPSDTSVAKSEFKEAFQLYKSKQFDTALEAFETYRQRYPESDLSDDALFVIAYIYFLRGDYDESSLRLFELTRLYPKSNQIDEATWWLGVSLERSGDVNGAIDMYKKLLDLPPQNPVRIKADFRLQGLMDQNNPE